MKNYNSYVTRTIGSILFLALIVGPATGQDAQSFIYGTVYTTSSETYEGFMRWSKEEVFWHDIFNSIKSSESAHARQAKAKDTKWWDFDFDFNIWTNKYQSSGRMFACHFGDIASLEMKRNGLVLVGLKNDAVIEVRGGSNDIGATINMISPDIGSIKLPWNRIKKVVFSEAPLHYDSPYGQMLYGTVEATRNRTFHGTITWDLDERLSDDILDGESRQGDHEIPFGLIESIESISDNACRVALKSGREMILSGSNDVDKDNRGIAIFDANRNNIEVSWKDFIKATFEPVHDVASKYRDFHAPQGMHAQVVTIRGKKMEGRIAFDLDEVWEMEFLDGRDDDIEYQIPFRNIKRIIPKNKSYSMIELRSGQSILLGDGQDVSGANDGLLLFVQDQKDPERLPWDDIDEIVFR